MSDRSIYHGRLDKSIFPPEKITPVFLPRNDAGLFKTTAIVTAEDGSTIIFILSQTNRMDEIISFSDTV